MRLVYRPYGLQTTKSDDDDDDEVASEKSDVHVHSIVDIESAKMVTGLRH